MNYLEFFELNQEPFSNAPVARFYYDSQQHSNALQRLRIAVEAMKGLAILVGDIGAGKTTLARRLLDSLPEEQFEAALLMVVHAETTASWLLSRIALLLGVDNPAEDKLRLLSQLYQRLVAIHQAGKRAVVLIDEAQMLRSKELMEEFRGLLNLELTEKKLLTFVFFGLTELDEALALDPPLKQRVAVRVKLEPLSRTSTAAYVAHRLKLAGAKRPLLSEAAIDAVHRGSHGTPRLINTLCDNALLEAFFLRQGQVDEAIVARVAEDLGLSLELPAVAAPPLSIAPAPAAAAIATSAPPGSVAARSVPAAAPAARPAPRIAASVPRSSPVAVATPKPGFSPAGAAARAVVVAPPVLDLGVEAELVNEAAGPAIAPAPRAVPSTPPASQGGGGQEVESADDPSIEVVEDLPAGPEEIEIPQIDALDDIDSILDQLEEKN